jgi:hypothetical protein
VGYNALKNIRRGKIADMHLHMWDTQFRGKGFGQKLFCMSAMKFFELFEVKIILCEPKSTNEMPNRMLQKIGYEQWKSYMAQSSELTFVEKINSYMVDRETTTRFLSGI